MAGKMKEKALNYFIFAGLSNLITPFVLLVNQMCDLIQRTTRVNTEALEHSDFAEIVGS